MVIKILYSSTFDKYIKALLYNYLGEKEQMGRKNITSERIVKILDGKILRFTDILDEYKRLYHKTAFKQIADNLKILEKQGIVSQIVGHYCLTDDLGTGKFKQKYIQLARERDLKLHEIRDKFGKIANEDMDRRFKQLIAENDHTRIRKMVGALEQTNEALTLALVVESPYSEFDRDRIRHLIAKQKEQIAILNQQLEKGVFVCELEKSKHWIEQGYSFDRIEQATLKGLDGVTQQNSLEQIEKTVLHLEEQTKTGEEWLSKHNKNNNDYDLARKLYDLTTKLQTRLKGEKNK